MDGTHRGRDGDDHERDAVNDAKIQAKAASSVASNDQAVQTGTQTKDDDAPMRV